MDRRRFGVARFLLGGGGDRLQCGDAGQRQFERQPQAYREEVLPPEVTVRLAIEAAAPFGWERYVGPRGAVIGMTRFGASAPYQVLAEKFGFTAANVVRKVHELIGR